MPLLTLHVLPPAFGLPSVSPDSILAIAWLRYTQQYGTWIVVADAAEYPNRISPFLVPTHHHLEAIPDPIEGFDAIMDYLQRTSDSAHLDRDLSQSQRSEALAISSHLQLRLRPLIALSLYVCTENYSSLTRPSFAKVLPFPESWILPHRLYDQALESCAHLGIIQKDLSLLAKDSGKTSGASLADAGPATGDDAYAGLKPGEKTNLTIAAKVKLQRRIDDLVYAALAPLISIRNASHQRFAADDLAASTADRHSPSRAGHWLFDSAHPTSADLTAMSLLSLAILPYSSTKPTAASVEPTLTIPLLSSSINKQFPKISSTYLMPSLEVAFGGQTSLEQALISAPLTASATEEEEDDEGVHDDAIEGYGNMDVGSGQVEIPWRRRRQGSGWEGAQRFGNAITTLFADSIGV